MNRKEGYGFVVAVHSPENTGDPPTNYVRRRDGAKLIFEGPPAQVLADVPFAKDEDGAKTRRLHLVRIAPRSFAT
eukprot:scaffold1922_cov291-Chaetoceros_neogracile.AAC.20